MGPLFLFSVSDPGSLQTKVDHRQALGPTRGQRPVGNLALLGAQRPEDDLPGEAPLVPFEHQRQGPMAYRRDMTARIDARAARRGSCRGEGMSEERRR